MAPEKSGELAAGQVLDLQQVASNMSRHGMVVIEDLENDELRIAQPFKNIDSPDKYIFREGFDDYRDTHGLGKHVIARIFSTLIYNKGAGSPGYYRSFNEFSPNPSPGIVIARRKDLGVPRYPIPEPNSGVVIQYVSRYAIEAASLVEATGALRAELKTAADTPKILDQILVDMSLELENQFAK